MNRDTRMDAIEEATSLKEYNMTLDRLTKSDYGPFLLLFFLFLAGFVIFAGGMILVVIGGRISLVFSVLLQIFVVVIKTRGKWALKNHKSCSRVSICNEMEKWVVVLGWFLPRKHREAILGDMMEDCHEMRERGFNERRIRNNVFWQLVISVVMLIPRAIIAAVWWIVSPTK